MAGDYIKIDRKILKWEWYKNINTKVVFFHCLLNANWCDGRYEGVEVPRGSFVSTLPKMSKDLGLTVMQTRTAINHLKLTGELTVKQYSKFSVITVNNYDQYQLDNSQCNSQVTGKQQASNRQVTGNKEEEMNREEGSGEEKGTKEERERTKEKEESGLKVEGSEVEKSKEVEGKRREEGNNILKKEVLKKENSKPESMEQMYQRVSVDYNLSDPLYDKLKEWFKYKQERHQTYKERGMRSLLKQAVNSSHEYGDMNVCDLIDFSMQSNYQGIFWERLNRKSKKTLDEIWRDV